MARADAFERTDPQDALALDESTLDPKLHYRFVNPRNMGKRKSQGYEVVLRSESEVRLLGDEPAIEGEGGGSADDLIRSGQLILMACKKERFEERRKQIDRLSRDRLGSSEARFHQEAKRRRVRSITDEGG